jgi:cytochrome bd-type quinol oxidase subunit 1
MTPIEFPGLGAKWAIGFLGLFHTSVASLGIGFAFFVTIAQIVAYRRKEHRFDLMAKRIQLIHVCIYNIGTINAIGLVFALSGLYPQFWSQIFVQFYWPLIFEEFLFFLLATTLTFHYFFWDRLWGHKKLHIFLGALLTPLFFLQFYIINGLGSFMITPGVGEAELSLRAGVLGWDRLGFYNPSFLMLTAHRSFANVAYGSFGVAGICGALLYLSRKEKMKQFYEDGGRLAFYIGFAALLSLPIVGYFYAHVLKSFANEAYVNLMWGKGDVVAGGIDWWWLKQLVVAAMLGLSISCFKKTAWEKQPSSALDIMVYAVTIFYVMFYFAMGMIMTWAFFFYMLAIGIGGALLGRHLINFHKGSPRGAYLLVGIFSFLTVMLGGYSREAARPRFVNRISHYDSVFVPEDRQPYLLRKDITSKDLPEIPVRQKPSAASVLIRQSCIGCHTLERVKAYKLENWNLIVRQMMAYGLKLTSTEFKTITEHLESKKPY